MASRAFVEHFVRTGDIMDLRTIFGDPPWLELLWQTRKDMSFFLLQNEQQEERQAIRIAKEQGYAF